MGIAGPQREWGVFMQFGTHSSTGSTAQVVRHSLDDEPAAGSRPGTMVRTASQAQQQLVDRSKQNSGCNGGLVDAANPCVAEQLRSVHLQHLLKR